jgi:nitroreductase
MNGVLKTIMNRKSVRVFEKREIEPSAKEQILASAMRAPTAGNLMLYSIIDVSKQSIKDTLAKTCDNQPFIAKAPLVLLFLADYQRWYDYFNACGVPRMCSEKGVQLREPQEGDLFLACCDALIAAQTAVIAAESIGIGSCYIGDIMENFEIHRDVFSLPRFVFPICLLCFGYPAKSEIERKKVDRFDQQYIVFTDQYKRLEPTEQNAMFQELHEKSFKDKAASEGPTNVGQSIYLRKFNAQFALEMNRSVGQILKVWKEG